MGVGDKIVKKGEELTDKTLEAADKVLPGRGSKAAASQDASTGEIISCSSWMGGIPDGVPVTALSIPGTHDSGCLDGPMGFAQTQNLEISEQLDAGIRFLDIRLSHYHDDLHVHHDVVYMGKSYKDILGMCADFLTQHPSETILMLVDDEERFDEPLGDLAPSEFLTRVSMGELKSRDNTRSFEDESEDQTFEQTDTAQLFYNFIASPPGGRSVTTAPAFTSETTLGDVRGKIILLRKFQSSRGAGFDTTYWLDNASTRSSEDENGNPRSTVAPIYDVEDHYNDPDDKYGLVVTHIEKAKNGDIQDLYVTFSSAVTLQASGHAESINPRLSDYLAASPKARVGIIAMDYFEDPRELVSNVIRMNSQFKA